MDQYAILRYAIVHNAITRRPCDGLLYAKGDQLSALVAGGGSHGRLTVVDVRHIAELDGRLLGPPDEEQGERDVEGIL